MKEIRIHYRKGELDSNHMRILASSSCNSFFSGSFVRENGEIYGYFDTGKFQLLTEIGKQQPEEVCRIAQKFLKELKNAENYFIFVEDHRLGKEHIYYNPVKKEIKLVLPTLKTEVLRSNRAIGRERGEERNPSVGFIDAISQLMEPSDVGYLRAIREIMLSDASFTGKMIRLKKLEEDASFSHA